MHSTRRSFLGASALALGSAGAAAAQLPGRPVRAPVSVKDFGAAGDGVTDDRAAIARAVAGARGKRLIFPEGNYLINSNGGPIILEEVSLDGQGVLDGATGSIDRGVNLWIRGTGNSPFRVRRGTSVSGMGIYYPDQKDSPRPTVHPATLAFDFSNGPVQFVHIRDNVIYNAYRFIDIEDSAGNVGHVEITGNYICALNRGIYVRHNSEHLRVERNNFTFGHWLQATEAGARAYMRAHATALHIDQSDGVEFVDNLVFGQLNGVLASAAGLCQFMNISLNKFDQARFGVRAVGPGRFDGHIAANTFNAFNPADTAQQGRCVSIETSGSGMENITIDGNSFDLATEDLVYINGDTPARYVVVGPNNYRSWAGWKNSGAFGAINANGARTNVQVTGGWFFGGNNAPYSIGIMGAVDTLQITGASFSMCQAALMARANSVSTTGNRSFGTRGQASATVASGDFASFGDRWDKPGRA